MESTDRRPPHPAVEASGTPLARNDERGALQRQRSERLAHYSRYALVMTGAVTFAAAAALWRLHPSGLATGLTVFGAVLILLGFVQHLLLHLERARWPDQAYLWSDGVELVLHNGEVRAVEWNDPKLAFDLFQRPLRGDPAGEILLEWKMGGYVPPCPLTEDGFRQLQTAAVAHHLGMAEFRHGRREQEIRVFEVRPGRKVLDGTPAPAGMIPADQ